MVEGAARSNEVVEKLQAGLSDLVAQVALVTNSQQQMMAQIELAHRAATDHMRNKILHYRHKIDQQFCPVVDGDDEPIRSSAPREENRTGADEPAD
jgi:hypothetical protein